MTESSSQNGVGAALGDVRRTDLEHILQAAADIALVLDAQGRIHETILGTAFDREAFTEWEGTNWNDVVSPETRPKVQALLEEGGAGGVSRFRQLNHPMPDGDEIPVGYTVVRLSGSDRYLAVGKNLKSLADLQQQLVEAQQAMESEYWHVRQAEARYRLLFQQSHEPVFLVEADQLRVSDANNAAGALVGTSAGRLVGRPFPPPSFKLGTAEEPATLAGALDQLNRGAVSGLQLPVRVGEADTPWKMHLSLARFDDERVLLCRFTPERATEPSTSGGIDVLHLLDGAPDGFIVADLDGNVLLANQAFLRMAQAAGQEAVEGRSLGLWLGRPGADLTVLLTNLRRNGQMRFFATTIQGEHGLSTEVEVSAVAARDAEVPCMGVVIRDVSSRLGSPRGGARDLNRAVEDLTTQVGRVSLKQLVEDTVALVELHFIDAALQLTGDNRTAAAELLGLSRQSLYTKLKRYNLDGSSN
jgi:transcriptional regulator PpsR